MQIVIIGGGGGCLSVCIANRLSSLEKGKWLDELPHFHSKEVTVTAPAPSTHTALLQ
jgi:hypothetical protein